MTRFFSQYVASYQILFNYIKQNGKKKTPSNVLFKGISLVFGLIAMFFKNRNI